MLDFIAHFFLKFAYITFILPVVLVGVIFHRRDLYAKAVCFVFVAMVFNSLLKQLFKVPLFPHLGPGYAFPSGHMHAATVFYGYILYEIDNKFIRTVLLFLMCSFGFSLIHCHFHDLIDVMGAVAFAFAEIVLYHFILLNFGERATAITAIATVVFSMAGLLLIYKLEWHVWLAFYAIIGTIFSLGIFKNGTNYNLIEKFFSLGIAVILIAMVYFIFKKLAFKEPFLSEIRFFLLPIVTLGSRDICSRIRHRTVISQTNCSR
jgi:undecaprenyl-diphosphatase